jgi:hypothetical protein
MPGNLSYKYRSIVHTTTQISIKNKIRNVKVIIVLKLVRRSGIMHYYYVLLLYRYTLKCSYVTICLCCVVTLTEFNLKHAL